MRLPVIFSRYGGAAVLSLLLLLAACDKMKPARHIRSYNYTFSKDYPSCIWIVDDTSTYLMDLVTLERRKSVPIGYERGSGTEMWLVDGRKYLYLVAERPQVSARDLQLIDKQTMRPEPGWTQWNDYPLLAHAEIREVYLHERKITESYRPEALVLDDTAGNFYVLDVDANEVSQPPGAGELIRSKYDPAPLFELKNPVTVEHAVTMNLAVGGIVRDPARRFRNPRLLSAGPDFCIVVEEEDKLITVVEHTGKELCNIHIPEADHFKDMRNGALAVNAHYAKDTLTVMTYHREYSDNGNRSQFHVKAFTYNAKTRELLGLTRFVWN